MEKVAAEHERAGFASRAIAFFLDLAIVDMLLLLAGWCAQLIGTYLPLGRLFIHVLGLGVASSTVHGLVALVVSLLVFALYSIVFWSMIGQTPGKAILGLRVVQTSGKRPTVGCSIVRFLAYWISALPLFLGFLWVFSDGQRQGWHDKIAHTCVTYVRKPRPVPHDLSRYGRLT
jgi:uncharacterized RDD family membrane protein YckC